MQEQARFSVLGGAEPCRKLQGVSVKLRFSKEEADTTYMLSGEAIGM